MAHVLLTGATGFLGRQILRTLLEEGHHVQALVRPGREGGAARLAKLGFPTSPAVTALDGDLSLPGLGLSKAGWQTALQAEVIVHAGAPMQLDLKAEDAKAQIQQATEQILELAIQIQRKHGLSRFVHLVGFMSPVTASDADGLASPVATPDFMPKAAPYERAKFLADLRVRQAAKQHGFPLTVLHPGTVIGSSRTGETEQLAGFGLMVDAVRRGLMSATPGGADHWLPLVTVDDLALLTAQVIADPGAAGQTSYALDKQGPNMVELLQILADQLRMPRPRFTVPVSLLRSALANGGSRLTGILPQSLDFVTTKRFPAAVSFAQTRAVLPAVIADLDYRLARQGAPALPNGLERIRLGPVAGLFKAGTGTPWVILHGLFSSSDELVGLANALGDSPVYLLDLPGFGRSPLPPRDQPFETGILEALLAALEAIPGPVRLVGHSFGALLAARLAARRPAKVRDLHLLQPPLQRPGLPLPLPVTGRYPWLTRRLLRFGVTDGALQAGFKGAMPTGYAQRIKGEMTSPRIRYATAHCLRVLTKRYAGISLDEVTVPVHLVWGSLDQGYPVSWGQEAAQRHHHITLTILQEQHQFPLSSPAETAAALCQKR